MNKMRVYRDVSEGSFGPNSSKRSLTLFGPGFRVHAGMLMEGLKTFEDRFRSDQSVESDLGHLCPCSPCSQNWK